MTFDIIDKEGRYKRALAAVERDATISAHNRQVITDFDKWSTARGVGLSRRAKYLQRTLQFAHWFVKDFEAVTNKDIVDILSRLANGEIEAMYKRRYSPQTVDDYKIIFRTFFVTFLNKPEVVKDIKQERKLKPLQTNELWDENELYRLVDAGLNPMERAFLALMCETGCRISEIGTMAVKNCMPRESEGVKEYEIFVPTSKTDPRPLLLIWSAPYLAQWLLEHPDRGNPEAPLWTIWWGKLLPAKYPRLKQIVIGAAKRSGVTKRIYPHLIRHSVATLLVRRGYHPTKLLMRMGWSADSKMLKRYLHLAPEDMFNEERKLNGMKKAETVRQLGRCDNCGAPIPENGLCATCKAVAEERQLAEARRMELLRIQEQKEQALKTEMRQLVVDTIKPLLQTGSVYLPQVVQQFGPGWLDAGSQFKVRKDGWVINENRG